MAKQRLIIGGRSPPYSLVGESQLLRVGAVPGFDAGGHLFFGHFGHYALPHTVEPLIDARADVKVQSPWIDDCRVCVSIRAHVRRWCVVFRAVNEVPRVRTHPVWLFLKRVNQRDEDDGKCVLVPIYSRGQKIGSVENTVHVRVSIVERRRAT
jgi:hypothetical protein